MKSNFCLFLILLLCACHTQVDDSKFTVIETDSTDQKELNRTSEYNVNDTFVYQEFSLTDVELRMFWKDSAGNRIKNTAGLIQYLETDSSKLIFAMNGGMYLEDGSPQGLFVENGEIKKNINTRKSNFRNFYLSPNGIFSISKNQKAAICKSTDFDIKDSVIFATQSGPMLLIDGNYHSAFTKGSSNTHFRNGVGITKNGKVILAQSKIKVNFYDFATFFKNQNCDNALYLDGFVSRTYAPEQKWSQLDGDFGVIVGVLKR